MDRPIHSTPGAQSAIRGIDNGVDADLRNIANHQAELSPVREIDLHTRMVQPMLTL
jgi:hypothetical protein